MRRLWRDGLARRLELQPLGVHDVGELLARVLGASARRRDAPAHVEGEPGQPALPARAGARSVSNRARSHGAASVWIWEGPLRVSPELQELIAERCDGLDPATRRRARDDRDRRAADAGGRRAPRHRRAARAISNAHGLLRDRDATGAHATLRLAHPLFGQVLRAGISPLRAAGARARTRRGARGDGRRSAAPRDRAARRAPRGRSDRCCSTPRCARACVADHALADAAHARRRGGRRRRARDRRAAPSACSGSSATRKSSGSSTRTRSTRARRSRASSRCTIGRRRSTGASGAPKRRCDALRARGVDRAGEPVRQAGDRAARHGAHERGPLRRGDRSSRAASSPTRNRAHPRRCMPTRR